MPAIDFGQQSRQLSRVALREIYSVSDDLRLMTEMAPPTVSKEYHIPVMLAEALSFLDPNPGATILDATLGGAGHSAAIAERIFAG